MNYRTIHMLIFFILDGIQSHKLEASNPRVVTDDSHNPWSQLSPQTLTSLQKWMPKAYDVT